MIGGDPLRFVFALSCLLFTLTLSPVVGQDTVTLSNDARTLLPEALRDVYLDPTGRALFESTRNGDFHADTEAAFAGKSNVIGGAKVLLIDSQKRLWLGAQAGTPGTSVEMYDGKTWQTRRVSDLPASKTRKLQDIRFLHTAVCDAAGNVWLIDGHRSQGWWLHRFKPDGQWETKVLHERTLVAVKPPATAAVLDFAEPVLQIGPDGLFYASWSSARVDGGGGLGASGFVQFNGQTWSEYFYPAGSNATDNVQKIIPLPDGSVGFVRLIDEPRAVWMSSALQRPAPDLAPYLLRMTSLSSRDRDSATAELIAMGPRIRKAIQAAGEQTDDPEIKSRIPGILQEISKPPAKGIFGGKLTFSAWRLLHQARSGRVYLAVQNCRDRYTGTQFDEALVTVSPEGTWTAEPSPAAAYRKPIGSLQLAETPAGGRWYCITGEGVFHQPATGNRDTTTTASETDARGTLRGVDAAGRLFISTKQGVVVFTPGANTPGANTPDRNTPATNTPGAK